MECNAQSRKIEVNIAKLRAAPLSQNIFENIPDFGIRQSLLEKIQRNALRN